MRTTVVRIGVDPAGELSADQLRAGMTELAVLVGDLGAELIDNNLAAAMRGDLWPGAEGRGFVREA